MRIDQPYAEFSCDDCQTPIPVGVHGVLAHDGASKQYCGGCYAARAKWGYEFDARTWDQIEAQADADGDAPRGGEAVAYARDLALREK